MFFGPGQKNQIHMWVEQYVWVEEYVGGGVRVWRSMNLLFWPAKKHFARPAKETLWVRPALFCFFGDSPQSGLEALGEVFFCARKCFLRPLRLSTRIQAKPTRTRRKKTPAAGMHSFWNPGTRL